MKRGLLLATLSPAIDLDRSIALISNDIIDTTPNLTSTGDQDSGKFRVELLSASSIHAVRASAENPRPATVNYSVVTFAQ
jgi:hypothetical protein